MSRFTGDYLLDDVTAATGFPGVAAGCLATVP